MASHADTEISAPMRVIAECDRTYPATEPKLPFMRITLKDIAREAGVSIYAVSHILRGDTRYNLQTAARVKAVAERLGYRPNRQAQVLRGGKSGVIGMIQVVSVVQTTLERSLFAGTGIQKQGYGLLAYDIHWHSEGLEHAIDAFLDYRVEGVLVCGTLTPDKQSSALQRLVASGIPLVTMGTGGVPGYCHVAADFFQGGQLQARHCLRLGYRSPVFILAEGDLVFESVRLRLQGARSVFEKAGIRLNVVETKRDLSQTREHPLEANYAPGYEAACQILKGRKKYDVLIGSNDYLAIAAIQAFHDHGVSVPDDLAEIGRAHV